MQSRVMSVVESVSNVAVGYVVAVMTQIAVFPFFALQTSFRQNLLIGVIFTLVSLVRSYALRRFFDRLNQR
jgi:hypothetical protein